MSVLVPSGTEQDFESKLNFTFVQESGKTPNPNPKAIKRVVWLRATF